MTTNEQGRKRQSLRDLDGAHEDCPDRTSASGVVASGSSPNRLPDLQRAARARDVSRPLREPARRARARGARDPGWRACGRRAQDASRRSSASRRATARSRDCSSPRRRARRRAAPRRSAARLPSRGARWTAAGRPQLHPGMLRESARAAAPCQLEPQLEPASGLRTTIRTTQGGAQVDERASVLEPRRFVAPTSIVLCTYVRSPLIVACSADAIATRGYSILSSGTLLSIFACRSRSSSSSGVTRGQKRASCFRSS